jgi:GTP-binding protein HflX
MVEEDLHVPYSRQQLRGEIFAACEVLGERYTEDGVVFRVRASAEFMERWRSAQS